MNEYDSNRISDLIKKFGYKKTNDVNNIDCYILNTCHIREKATEKVYHDIGRLKKKYKNKKKPIVLITGCVAQAENKEMIRRENYIDAVIGPQSYQNIPEILKKIQKKVKKFDFTDFDVIEKFDQINKLENFESKISSYLTIQEGCDKFCNFCVVPFTRGPEYSRPFKEVVTEAKILASNGAKEITLLGQNVNSYGRDLKIDNKSRPYFSQLLHKLNEIDGLERIRFTSPHPKDFKEETINAVNTLNKVCNQIHIPLQSGSSEILAKMHRGYNKQKFIQKVDMIKKIIPDVSLTTDIIVGFPGESDSDFKDTMDIVKYVEFDSIYMFQFSPRPGTRAQDMESSFISKDIIKERFKHLKDVQTDISEKKLKRFVGTKQTLLIDKQSKKNDKVLTGKIDSGQITHIDNKYVSIGDMVQVKVTDSTPFYLKAELI